MLRAGAAQEQIVSDRCRDCNKCTAWCRGMACGPTPVKSGIGCRCTTHRAKHALWADQGPKGMLDICRWLLSGAGCLACAGMEDIFCLATLTSLLSETLMTAAMVTLSFAGSRSAGVPSSTHRRRPP